MNSTKDYRDIEYKDILQGFVDFNSFLLEHLNKDAQVIFKSNLIRGVVANSYQQIRATWKHKTKQIIYSGGERTYYIHFSNSALICIKSIES